MPFTRDIAATYAGPGKVMRRLRRGGHREDRALAILMGACVILFIARWPALARQAYETGEELSMLLGTTLMATVILLPLLFYALAFFAHWVARALRGKGSAFDARLALFWSLLASSPLLLLNGLVAGFIGPGIELTLVGTAWLAVFVWFWLAGMVALYRRAGHDG
ncbi:YIP1 family protein [Marivita sp. GX14005]|uniref:YIP1 family protein n=1 Tax=Marivita sp. GX14005 TaxID=2942276 RepID=UPI002018CA52|nr:YIP1 family protein [Marivita sp. GX14005]MCL3883502.1 YIP1 family protein [Marivita sp. GX14005]